MRLSQKEVDFIKSKILEFMPDSEIYIFGSILKDNVRGGDIDIYIVTNNIPDFLTKSDIKFELERKLYRPVDLVFHKDFNLLIEKEAKKGIKI
jgi:predicted nucleotidyltransferase